MKNRCNDWATAKKGVLTLQIHSLFNIPVFLYLEMEPLEVRALESKTLQMSSDQASYRQAMVKRETAEQVINGNPAIRP